MQWTSDFRHAWRALLRTPGFLVTSVVTLALAIGAVVGMFNVVNTVLLRPLPFPDSDRLVVLSGHGAGIGPPRAFRPRPGVLPPLQGALAASRRHLPVRRRDVDAAHRRSCRADPDGVSDQRHLRHARRPSADRTPPGARGRRPRRRDQRPALDQLVRPRSRRHREELLRRRAQMREVIGVMPPEFRFPSDDTLLWVPSEIRPAEVRPGQLGAPLDRAHEAWRDARAARRRAHAALEGAAGALRRPAQLRAAHRTAQRGRRAAARAARRSHGHHVAVGAAGRGVGRAADRLRQRRESVHGPRRGAPARSGGAPRDRRVAGAARPPPDGRRRSSSPCWRACSPWSSAR